MLYQMERTCLDENQELALMKIKGNGESYERQLMLRLEELARLEGLRNERPNLKIPSSIRVLIDSKASSDDVLKKDGSVPLTDDWDAGDGKVIFIDTIKARDADGLTLADSNNAGIFIKEGGNVGIGTTSPTTLLELSETDTSPILTFTSQISDPYIAFRTGSPPETQVVVGIDYSDSNKLKIVRGSDISTSTGVTIDSAGNVGIGTVTPMTKLDISGMMQGSQHLVLKPYGAYKSGTVFLANSGTTIDGSIGFFAGGADSSADIHGPYFYARGNDYTAISGQRGQTGLVAGRPTNPAGLEGCIRLFAGGGDVLIVHRDKKVGIGTTTPSAKLAVNGGLHVGGDSDPGNDNLLVDGKVEIDGDLDHDGSNVGFYGTAPIPKPVVTGSRGGNEALTSLLSALANLGLITNSTT